MPGSLYLTQSYNLKCKYIIHAVTMWLPGTFSRKKTIKRLLPKILEKANELELHSIAIPLLGTGVGHLKPNDIMELYHLYFDKSDTEVNVYMLKSKFGITINTKTHLKIILKRKNGKEES